MNLCDQQLRPGPHDSCCNNFSPLWAALHVTVHLRLSAEFRAAVLQYGLPAGCHKVRFMWTLHWTSWHTFCPLTVVHTCVLVTIQTVNVFSSQNSDGKYPCNHSAVQSVMGCWNGDLCKLCWLWSIEFGLHQQNWRDCAFLRWGQIRISSWSPRSLHGQSVQQCT